MSATNVIILAAEATESSLPLPPWGFAAIAAVFFGLLGFIVLSYRDVFNRHGDEIVPTHPALEAGKHVHDESAH